LLLFFKKEGLAFLLPNAASRRPSPEAAASEAAGDLCVAIDSLSSPASSAAKESIARGIITWSKKILGADVDAGFFSRYARLTTV
jgi:hypothetical protein